ncbi:hypothetical protein V2J09_021831 [Rumex salicifolius]
MLDDGKMIESEIDIKKLGGEERKLLIDNILKVVEEDNEKFLRILRDRTDRVGIEIPKVEIRYEHLSVDGDVYALLGLLGLVKSKKKVIKILQDVSGIVKPSRMTLLLGPPGAGKTTLLLALASKLDKDLRVQGKITYCGHEFKEFVPQRTCAYISQHDLHFGEMTVKETLDFSGRCLGVGTRYELLAELARREKEAGIKPDPEIDAFMKGISIEGQKTNFVTDYVLKILGLDLCADTMIGNEMMRGISGGQKKRVTTGEMLVGPSKVLLMDEISTGLDSSTTFQICKYMRQMVHIMDVTMIISLLQPAPETYELFDDVILLSEGKIAYQGPRDNVLEFFESMGFKCPDRKGVADFLQEVTSKKDQEQYWSRRDHPYRYVSVTEFVEAFTSFHISQQQASELSFPYDKTKTHEAALVKQKYGLSNRELFKACLSREWLLMKRNSFVYIFKTVQLTIMSLLAMTVFFRTTMHHNTVADGEKFLGALFFSLINVMFNGFAELAMTVSRLPVFYKQRDFLFYPSWAYALPMWLTRIPVSFVESAIWVIITYYTIGYAPSFRRFLGQFLALFSIHHMSLSLFRVLGAIGRSMVIANAVGILSLLLVFVLGGFVIAKQDISPWVIWGYYTSPMMYGQNAIVMIEFLDERWNTPSVDPRFNQSTVGRLILASRGFYTEEYWYWICIGALFGFSLLFNLLFILGLKYLNPFGNSRVVVLDEDDKGGNTNLPIRQETVDTNSSGKGMILPFQPLSLTFNHINYFVDMPKEMKAHGVEEDRLQLLRDVSGAFRPGLLTALMGVSGAGKTTLMDVLAGRKTGGYIEGSIMISGYPKKQETFARISGYCEQTDIHSPHVTVYESLQFSAWLRLSSDISSKKRKMFVEEVMELVELIPLRDALVGLPGVDGLSTEQRKRLTIAVELVANPSIIFMDEPTSGLDARAAAIVMRTVRNTVNTGRTVVCTIHQPSIDIFEAFDELLLMKRGGQVIYEGPLGHNSSKLVEYFEAIPRVSRIQHGNNPATWMLEISTPLVESQLNVDFAEVYANSFSYQSSQELIAELSTPALGYKDLYFQTQYSQPFLSQCKVCFWKQYWSYWRNPPYIAVRFLMTIISGLIFGVIFWNKGGKIDKMQDLMNLVGALYTSFLFLGATNTRTVLPSVAVERTIFYRERAAGMYSAIPYAYSLVAVEIIYNLIQGLIYALLLYSMIGLEWTAIKFFYFYYFILMCFIYFTLFGMMLVALTPGDHIGAIIMTFFLALWNLFSGFIIPFPQIPIWWRWYYWASPVAWTVYGTVTSQVGDKDVILLVPGSESTTVKAFLKDYFGFQYEFLPVVVIAHVGWVLFFMFVFAYGIKFLNFQRR